MPPKKRAKRAPLRAKKARKSTTGVSTAVKSYVNKTIHSNIENKRSDIINDLLISTYNVNPDLNCQPLMPIPTGYPTGGIHIYPGTGQGDRLGNTIKSRRLTFRYIVTPTPYISDVINTEYPQPQELRMMFGFIKGSRTELPDNVNFNQLFQFGNSSNPPYSNLWDMIMPVNQDLFTICKSIVIKVGTQFITNSDAITTPPTVRDYQIYSNNDFKLNQKGTVDLTKYINKTIKFNDTSGYCDTGLYVWFLTANSDGTVNNNAQTLRVMYSLSYEYEDA